MAEPVRMERSQFLWLATLFEGCLAVVAALLAWWLGQNPLEMVHWRPKAVSIALLGTLPLLLFFGLFYRLEWPQLERIKRLLIETLGPLLATCRWYELAYVAFLAGFCEELLFRGVLQPWMTSLWGWWPALVVSNVLFGLAHSVTFVYAVLAALTGMYLGWMLYGEGSLNLLIPILIHTVYDFAAFLVLVMTYRAERRD